MALDRAGRNSVSLQIQIEAPVIVAADGFGSGCGWWCLSYLLSPYCKAESVLQGGDDQIRMPAVQDKPQHSWVVASDAS